MAALERLAAAAQRAAPQRVARVIPDLGTERALAEADAARMAAEGNEAGSMTASEIAAGITRIRELLQQGETFAGVDPDDEAETNTPGKAASTTAPEADFQILLADARSNGWKTARLDGEWRHRCSACVKANRPIPASQPAATSASLFGETLPVKRKSRS